MTRVAVVVPAYNEAKRFEPAAFEAAVRDSPGLHFLFVDDGSRDDTSRLIQGVIDSVGLNRASLLRLDTNVGKAEAVRRGICALFERGISGRGVAVGYWDADRSTPLPVIRKFLGLLETRPEAVAVIGSRVRLMGRHIERGAMRHYAGRVFATLASIALGVPVYDTQCGAKLFRANTDVERVFERPFRTRWAFDVEILARLSMIYGEDLGRRGVVLEFPLESWSDVPGSKVRIRDLPSMLLDLLQVYREIRGFRRSSTDPARPSS